MTLEKSDYFAITAAYEYSTCYEFDNDEEPFDNTTIKAHIRNEYTGMVFQVIETELDIVSCKCIFANPEKIYCVGCKYSFNKELINIQTLSKGFVNSLLQHDNQQNSAIS